MDAEKANNNKRDFSQVQVINRAVNILRAVRQYESINLSQLARKVGLARSTVYRIVATLESEGLLAFGGNGDQIQLGTEFVTFGAAVHSDFRQELRPYIEDLASRTNETVDLAILDQDHLLFLDQAARPQRLRAVSGVGLTFPLHCTANGKALLSEMPIKEIFELIPETLPAFTSKTIKTRDDLLKELDLIRSVGVAFDREEHTLGICAVSIAVYGPSNQLAAISIPVPSVRFYGNENILVTALLEAREIINNRFRY